LSARRGEQERGRGGGEEEEEEEDEDEDKGDKHQPTRREKLFMTE
jgi:hypothetical protein